mgnify:CR=1 FL=1
MKEYMLNLKDKQQHNVGLPTFILSLGNTNVLLMTH